MEQEHGIMQLCVSPAEHRYNIAEISAICCMNYILHCSTGIVKSPLGCTLPNTNNNYSLAGCAQLIVM